MECWHPVSRYPSRHRALFLVVQGNYRLVERIFLETPAATFTTRYPISAFLAHPPWKEVLVATVSDPHPTKLDHP
jgi:hypothetical protein